MKNRRWYIFLLTHFYPLFIAGHLQWGGWGLFGRLSFTIIPSLIVGALIAVWIYTSSIKLISIEICYLEYFVFMMAVINGYYCLCALSSHEWVDDHNYQMATFVVLTLIFYLYVYTKNADL